MSEKNFCRKKISSSPARDHHCQVESLLPFSCDPNRVTTSVRLPQIGNNIPIIVFFFTTLPHHLERSDAFSYSSSSNNHETLRLAVHPPNDLSSVHHGGGNGTHERDQDYGGTYQEASHPVAASPHVSSILPNFFRVDFLVSRFLLVPHCD